MAEKYDVIVAGGGPAGLAAARAAASQGGKVLLLEMQAQIGGQTRSASWVPDELLRPPLRRAVVAKMREITLRSPRCELSVRGSFGVVVDRRQFDKLLAAEAAERGAEIWLNSPVRDLVVKDQVVQGVKLEAGGWSEQVEGGVVVDATGGGAGWSSLFLRKVLGSDWQLERLALSNEYLMANVRDEGAGELIFNSYFSPSGHAWVYPMGRGFAIVGIYGVRIHPDLALDEFLGKQALPRLEGSVPVASFRNQLPLEGPLGRTYADGIIAVGAAAGQIYPLSGEGLRYAMRCGEIAGEVAVEAITEGDVSAERLSEYQRRWTAEFGSEFEAGKLLQSSLSISQDRKMDALLRALEGKNRLQRAFIRVFTGFDLRGHLKFLLRDGEVTRALGKATVERALAMK